MYKVKRMTAQTVFLRNVLLPPTAATEGKGMIDYSCQKFPKLNGKLSAHIFRDNFWYVGSINILLGDRRIPRKSRLETWEYSFNLTAVRRTKNLCSLRTRTIFTEAS